MYYPGPRYRHLLDPPFILYSSVHETVAPTCLWLDDEVRFPKLLSAGWGRTGFGKSVKMARKTTGINPAAANCFNIVSTFHSRGQDENSAQGITHTDQQCRVLSLVHERRAGSTQWAARSSSVCRGPTDGYLSGKSAAHGSVNFSRFSWVNSSSLRFLLLGRLGWTAAREAAAQCQDQPVPGRRHVIR